MSRAIILIPCFNEEEVVKVFLTSLTKVLQGLSSWNFSILIVDDGSTDSSVEYIHSLKQTEKNYSINVLENHYNTGHQRALLIGLRHINQSMSFDRVIIMHGDGEDNPAIIPKLLKMEEFDIVHIVRGRREEGRIFKIGYFIYKRLTKLFLGAEINFGNFCMISPKVVNRVALEGFLHLPAYLSKLIVPKSSLLGDRSERIGGTSKMNFDSLILHGLKSLGEYTERIVLFIFKLVLLLILIFLLLIIFISYLKYTGQASPGWASNLISSLINSILICGGFLLMAIIHLRSQETLKNLVK